jgi:hypothetical protein
MKNSVFRCRLAHIRSEVSEEYIALFIKGYRISDLGTLPVSSIVTANVVSSFPILSTLIMQAIRFFLKARFLHGVTF